MRLAPVLALSALGLALAPASVSAQSFEAIYARGHALYDAGRYEEAARTYQALVDAGVDDADVYFDLGTAWAGAMKYGRAMLAFERALDVDPSDRAAEQSLSSAEAMIARRRADREGDVTTAHRGTPLDALGRTFPERAWAIALLVSAWLGFGALTLLLFARRESGRLALGVVAAAGFCVGAASALGLAARRGTFHEGPPMIVLDDDVPLHEAPDARSRRLGTVSEGDRGEILENRDGFSRVRVAGRGRGWVASAHVGSYTTR